MSLNRLLKRSGPPSGGATPAVTTVSSNVSVATTAAAKGGKSPEDIIKGEIQNIYNKCENVLF